MMKRNPKRRQRDDEHQREHHHKDEQTDAPPPAAGAAAAASAAAIPAVIPNLFTSSPITTIEDFFATLCDTKHMHVPLKPPMRSSDFYETVFPVAWSTQIMRNAIKSGTLRHRVDVDIVKYSQQERRRINFVETLQQDNDENNDDSGSSAMMLPPIVTVEDFDRATSSGWSVRFLRPQEHSTSISKYMFALEEELQCSCGLNSYWTPGNSQGFAPHFDDVDVFLLQLEGQKHWRLHPPVTDSDVLSRVSSEDFQQEQLAPPMLDIVLKKGEMLYMPRGTVHQGDTIHVGNNIANKNEPHSLHVTLSAFQMHTWADLIAETFKYRVEFVAANGIKLRHTLPLGWKTVMGSLVNPTMMGPHVMPLSPQEKKQRGELQAKMRAMFTEIHNALMTKDGILDKGADAVARGVLLRRQPPPPPPSSSSSSSSSSPGAPVVVHDPTHIRLVFKEAVRFVMMTDEVRLYHCGGNSLICMAPREHREPRMVARWSSFPAGSSDATGGAVSPAAGFLRFDVSFSPALAKIISKSPSWLKIDLLPGFASSSPEGAGEFDEEEEEEPPLEREAFIDALLATRCFEVRA